MGRSWRLLSRIARRKYRLLGMAANNRRLILLPSFLFPVRSNSPKPKDESKLCPSRNRSLTIHPESTDRRLCEPSPAWLLVGLMRLPLARLQPLVLLP